MSVDLDTDYSGDDSLFQTRQSQLYRTVLREFKGASQAFVLFNLIFGCALTAEALLLVFCFPFLNRTSILAFVLGAFLLTLFSFVIFRIYLQAKKPDQWLQLKDQFLVSYKRALPMPPGTAGHHLSAANALMKLAHYLQDFESHFYKVPSYLRQLNRLISSFSTYCYASDVFSFKEQLLLEAIEEHVQQIRIAPSDLEVHASLASAYLALAAIYRTAQIEDRSKYFANLALEEFHILCHFAPNDPWVHEQLAAGYKELEMAPEETKETELLLKLRPQDQELLFRLGLLYFQQRLNGKGLQIYEQLKKSNPKQAEALIGAYALRNSHS
ncbi:MAG: hypothetical protein RL235_204 [Chlamydiota bacterium]